MTIFSFFQYMFEVNLCLLVFALCYALFFVRLTHFAWMRFYLLSSIALSCTLPFIDISLLSFASTANNTLESINALSLTSFQWLNLEYNAATSSANIYSNNWPWLVKLLVLIYAGGVVYKSYSLIRTLLKIRQLIQLNPKERESNYWTVHVTDNLSAFSFLNYIFIGRGLNQLDKHEIQQVKNHELIHVQQKHTLDLLLFELPTIVFWFNPIIGYLKKSLQEVHEYLADAAVVGKSEKKRAYAHLLIKLASPLKPMHLVTSFSNKQIHNRITMLMKTRTLAQKKLYFLLLLPLIASLLLLLSCIDESKEDIRSMTTETLNEVPAEDISMENGKKIASINWKGNTVYSDEQLSKVLGLKPGDIYNEELINSRLHYNPEHDDVSSLYMDHGYLFFGINVNEHPRESGAYELVFDINEGDQIKTDHIIIKGNKSVSKEKILNLLPIKSGEWFSRNDFIASQKVISEMGYFDPEKVNINPIPHPEEGTVDIEIILTEKQPN